jgi:hypothetical protein
MKGLPPGFAFAIGAMSMEILVRIEMDFQTLRLERIGRMRIS